MDIRNKYKVVYFINQVFFKYFLEDRKTLYKKVGAPHWNTPTI